MSCGKTYCAPAMYPARARYRVYKFATHGHTLKSACIRPFWKRLLFGRCFSHPKRERLRNATVALQNSAQNGRCYSARYRVKKLPALLGTSTAA